MDDLLCLLLLRECCISDGGFSGRVANIHVVCPIFIGLDEVCDHVDVNLSIGVVLGYFDV